MAVIGETEGRFYLLDMVNERLDIVGTMNRLQAKCRQWGPSRGAGGSSGQTATP